MIAALFAVWDMFAQEPQDGHPAAEKPAAEARRDP